MSYITDASLAKFRKPTRTISGVSPIAVMCVPRACKHGACTYCPSLNAPQSYTPLSPAVLRASMMKYDSFEQVICRLKAYEMMKHPSDKVELIIMGGTFLSYPLDYQYNFVKRCYDALNGKISETLEEAKKINENAKHRCVALCIETRPDYCSDDEIKRMLDFGCTRVEIGVQVLDDAIYKRINRGHKVKDVIEATKRLKDAGFKVGYHLMPGLPGMNPEKDLKLFEKVFSDDNFKPDQLKIYPTQVIVGSELVGEFENKKYKPYSEQELVELIVKMKQKVPEYCRIMRIMREIPPQYLVAGTTRIDLRKVINQVMKQKDMRCKCIRCREIGFVQRDNPRKNIDMDLKMKIINYVASGERELFIEFVNNENVLFGLIRLRIVGKTLFVRELHVHGPQIEIGKKDKGKFQHKGLGAMLMEQAEKIASALKCDEIKVISGVGVREYYKNLGYELNEEYMTKKV